MLAQRIFNAVMSIFFVNAIASDATGEVSITKKRHLEALSNTSLKHTSSKLFLKHKNGYQIGIIELIQQHKISIIQICFIVLCHLNRTDS